MKLTNAKTKEEFLALANKRHKDLHPECDDINSRQALTVLVVLFEVIAELHEMDEGGLKEWLRAERLL